MLLLLPPLRPPLPPPPPSHDDDDNDYHHHNHHHRNNNNNSNNNRSRYLSDITGGHEIKVVPKNNHIGFWTQSTENTNVKVGNILYGRNNITCGTNCKYRTDATTCTLEIWFVGQIIVNKLLIGYNKDDDDDDNNNNVQQRQQQQPKSVTAF
jgi:hypothetical protein